MIARRLLDRVCVFGVMWRKQRVASTGREGHIYLICYRMCAKTMGQLRFEGTMDEYLAYQRAVDTPLNDREEPGNALRT